ncbi:MAG: hypothetical protein FD159_981 [Syntrophaceae bacterium]|nr:MAG: hypothetical protein FD159_981 [Syntrophaceae bacterium]
MKKRKKNNLLMVVLIASIVLSIAAIAYVIMFHREEIVVVKSPPEQKKQTTQQKAAAKERPQALSPAEELRGKAKDLPPLPPVAGTPAEEEDVVAAKRTSPRLKLKQIAIIIDDIGYDMMPVQELLRVDADITFAILPLLAHSREAADMLHKANRETLLHLPMEPLSYPKEKPGNGALFSDMNDEEIVFQLEKNLASVPYISGVNNHMGSKFMADEEKLILVFKQLKKKNLFFIDSRTTNNSKTTAASQKVHLTVASRKIFLDNNRDYSKIYQILMDVVNAPAGNEPLIVIGHPYPETIRAIRDANKSFREKGVSIVPVSKLMKKKSLEGAS